MGPSKFLVYWTSQNPYSYVLKSSKTKIGKRHKVKIRVQLPARRAYSPEGGVIWVINFISSVQVSGFGCQVSATEVDPLGRSRS